MGANASRGTDNQSLVDKLIDGKSSLPPNVERAMRLVDRGDYFERQSSRAYIDLAWRSGHIHLSAPSIYLSVLINLDLAPGQHFLNVGSGSGYFSTIAGLILGYGGLNHGIELIEENVEFAQKRLQLFLNESDAPLERDFCVPQFVQGNIFHLVCPCDELFSTPESTNISGIHSGDDLGEPEENDHMGPRAGSEDAIDIHDSQASHGSYRASPTVIENQSGEIGESSDQSSSYFLDVSIDPPPLVVDDKLDDSESNGSRWPMYDRIYVGAGIRNQTHLKSLLRLLKVGGILVAPVQDDLVKITRVASDRLLRVVLMSVSFAPLVIPQRNSPAFPISPPLREVPTLLRLSGRVIRSILRNRIEERHNGVPVLGRVKKIEPEAESKRHNTQHMTPNDSLKSCQNSESDSPGTEDETESHANRRARDSTSSESDHSAPSETARPSGFVARLLRNLIRHSRMTTGELSTTDSHPSADERENRSYVGEARSHSPTHPRLIMFNLLQEPGGRMEDTSDEDQMEPFNRFRLSDRLIAVFGAGNSSEPQTNPEMINPVSTSQEHLTSTCTNDHSISPRRKKTKRKLKYHPPSYRYRDEMRNIMSEELSLPDFFIRDAFLL